MLEICDELRGGHICAFFSFIFIHLFFLRRLYSRIVRYTVSSKAAVASAGAFRGLRRRSETFGAVATTEVYDQPGYSSELH